MKLKTPVFGPAGDFLVCSKAQGCIVVLMKNGLERAQVISTSKGASVLDINHVYSFDHLKQHISDRNDGSHCLTEGSIFCFTST